MFYASRLPSRGTCGPGTGLARKSHLTFLSGTYKLLTVLVEDVGVALNRIQSDALVDLGHDAIEWGIDTPGLNELIKVTCDDNICVFIQSENGVDEILEQQDEIPLKRIKHEKELQTAVTLTCLVRCSTTPFTNGRASPSVEELPPLELK